MNTMFEVSHLMKHKALQNVAVYFTHASACLPCVNKSAAGNAIWNTKNALLKEDERNGNRTNNNIVRILLNTYSLQFGRSYAWSLVHEPQHQNVFCTIIAIISVVYMYLL